MGRIYESEEDYNRAFEKDFEEKLEMLSAYQGEQTRETLDCEWTEGDLIEEVQDLAFKILGNGKGKGWLEEHKYCAVKDKDLLHDEFVSNRICDENDLIEIYNTACDKHRNDENKLFGIHYFDDEIKLKINKLLSDNLA
jgi:hypothetical protein